MQPTLMYSRSPILADEVEDDAFGPRIAKLLQFGILGVSRRLVEDRVEQELALLEAPARQPLDLQEELGAEAAQDLLGLRLVAFEEERGEDPLAPGLVVAIVRAEGLVHGGAEVVRAAPRTWRAVARGGSWA